MLRTTLLALALPATAWAQDARLVLPQGTDDTLRQVLENESLTLSLEAEGLTSPQDYVAAARADYRRLLTAAYSEGYYGPVISITVDGREASTIQPLDAPGAIGQVVLSVDPGPQFAFGRTVIAPLAPATELPPEFAPGEVARSLTIEEAVAAAIEAWRQEGNAKAEVGSEEIVAVHPERRLDVAVGIAPGPELTFGAVTVSGNRAVRTERVLAIAGIPSGRVFDPDVLERAATRLRRTGAFDSVAVVESDTIGPGQTLPIVLQVVEALPRRVGFGIEFSTTEGLSVTAFQLYRNLLGGAERLRFDAAVSDIQTSALDTNSGGLDYELGVSFARPATGSPDQDLLLEARASQEDEEGYFLRQATISAGFTRYVGDDLVLGYALGVLVAHEETPLLTRDYALLTLPLSATLDRRDDPQDARRGYFLDADLTPFVSFSGDTGSGARLYADGRIYRGIGERLTLAARAQVGSVYGAERDDVPQDFLFFSGGGGTVRGQPFQSLGVEVPDPDNLGETVTVGGTGFAALQLEARFDINETFGAVAFADAGYADDEPLPSLDGEAQAGVGLGVRYNSFVGPIRLDLATPATGDDAFNALQVYIGIGQSF
jgi:translocation and assembly module TamA